MQLVQPTPNIFAYENASLIRQPETESKIQIQIEPMILELFAIQFISMSTMSAILIVLRYLCRTINECDKFLM